MVVTTTDADLLALFVNQRDEEAFKKLVDRHSRAVLGLCRRILRNTSDAEDAFQATFLKLALKAGSIRKGQSVGGWLFTTACRIALRARKRAHQRAGPHQPLTDVAGAPEGDRADYRAEQDEVCSVIDAEVNRLPEKYRLPIVLCCYQGKSNEEAARELGHPLGTVQSNLSRGRNLLRDRLARRGVAFSAGVFSAALTPAVGKAAAPELVLAAVKGALASQAPGDGRLTTLAKAGLSSLTSNKLNRTAAVLVALILAGTGLGWVFSSRTAVQQPPPSQALDNNDLAEKEPPILERCRRLVVPKVLASLKGLAIGNRRDASVKSLRLTPDGKGIELQLNWKHGIGGGPESVDYESSATFEYHPQTGECKVWVKDVFSGQMRRVQPDRAIVLLRLHKWGWEWAIRLQGLDDAVAAFEVLRETRDTP
jgi:RNA polymerase sigma factor (sigma-70 family)